MDSEFKSFGELGLEFSYYGTGLALGDVALKNTRLHFRREPSSLKWSLSVALGRLQNIPLALSLGRLSEGHLIVEGDDPADLYERTLPHLIFD